MSVLRSVLVKRLALLVALLWLGLASLSAKAETTAEEILKAVVETITTPVDVPPWKILSVRAEGKIMQREFQLNDAVLERKMQRGTAHNLAAWTYGLSKAHRDLFCYSDFRELLKMGVIVQDHMRYSSGEDIVIIRIAETACRAADFSADFSGPRVLNPSLARDLQAYAAKVKTPLELSAMVKQKVTASGHVLRRQFEVTADAGIREFSKKGAEKTTVQQGWQRPICASMSKRHLLLGGAEIEDTMLAPDNKVLAVIVTDHAVCQKLSLND